MIAPRRLPGIRIDVTPPPLAEVLPRMDVAVFVGFAATGPTHRPVAIESAAEYAMIFGPDAPLAFNSDYGEPIYAYLGAAVRAFFSNGGRRCWVMRVARTLELETLWCKVSGRTVDPRELAVANRFAIPGVLAFSDWGASLLPAEAQARSVGSWSDGLQVQTALAAKGFALKDCVPASSPTTACMSFRTTAPLQPGDLIELDDPATSGAAWIRRYAIVDMVATLADDGVLSRQVEATLCAAFEPAFTKLESPPVAGTVETAGVTASQLIATIESVSASETHIEISFAINHSPGLALGQWVRFCRSDNMQIIWLQIEQLNSTPALAGINWVNVVVVGQAWVEVPKDNLVFPVPAPTYAASLTLDLRVLAGQTEVAHLEGVGLTAKHSSAWWRQVSDVVQYEPLNGRTEPKSSATAARFPLAARDEELIEDSPLAWIPLGVSALYGEALTALPQTATPLERDGLSRFDAELFLDPELALLGAGHLIEQADVIRFLSDTPRKLFGIHAALSIGSGGMYNEASLMAVPDALHTGWVKRPLDSLPTVTPAKATTPAHWYTHRGSCTPAPPAEDAKLMEPDFSRFLDCGTHKLNAPIWQDKPGNVPCGKFRLNWICSDSNAMFSLEESLRADFGDVRELYRGSNVWFDVNATREGILFYRVTAFSGDERSAASDTLAVAVRNDLWLSQKPEDYEKNVTTELLRIHRATLQLASANGELFAVLGLPRHYRAIEAIHYVTRLRAFKQGTGLTDAKGFDFNERRTLSYGAVYHPWIVSARPRSQGSTPASAEVQRAYPPDGVATGLLSARASLRGAWIAPANEPFRDVSALAPVIEPGALQSLQDAQINLIRADARGFLTLSADTLSDEPEWRLINVRRLFILLRRLALRRGTSYVFEPNDDVFRRAVERGFTFLLTDMFSRGAFAGATPVESFRVVTSGAINTNVDRDAGRFFVELQIAPSLPLQFLTIRLSQSGERFTVLEEA